MRLSNLFSLVIIISLLAAPRLAGSEVSELQLRMLLPQKEHLLGVQLSKAPEFFTGVALNSYLKDSSDIYREYGIDTLMTTAYYYSGEIISVEIYKMKDYRCAYAIFTVTKMPKEAEFKVGDGSVKSKSSLIFWQDSYFVKVVSLGRAEGTDRAMDGIARSNLKNIKS